MMTDSVSNLVSAIIAGHQNSVNDSDSDSEVQMEEAEKVYLLFFIFNKYLIIAWLM